MEYKILKTSVVDGIATLTISRPAAMNALNSATFTEINEFLATIENDRNIKALIITGEGKAFVAGADIAEMIHMNSQQGSDFSRVGQKTFNRIENFPAPVIAAINGYALGGGLELALACDFRIASNKAKFGQPEVNLGLIPGYSATQKLSRLTGLANALYLICTAETITAEDALRIGLVQKLEEPEQLMEKVNELAKKIASKGALSVRKSKEVIRKGFGMNMEAANELESREFGGLFGKEESGEGMKAFLEKRAPKWN